MHSKGPALKQSLLQVVESSRAVSDYQVYHNWFCTSLFVCRDLGDAEISFIHMFSDSMSNCVISGSEVNSAFDTRDS